MNKLYDLAVSPSDLGMLLIAAPTQEEARAVIGAGTGSGVAPVTSVNAKTGDVVLKVSDLENDSGYITNADIPDAPVVSINGKSGVVTLTATDVGAVATSDVGVTVASLVAGKIPNSQLPPLAITSTFTVSSQAAQLALDAQEGDVCIRTDLGVTYIHLNSNLGTMADWTQLLSPTAPVQSVNGKTGVVNITLAELGGATTASVTAVDTKATNAGTAAATAQSRADAAWTLANGKQDKLPITISATAPTSPSNGDIWIDIS